MEANGGTVRFLVEQFMKTTDRQVQTNHDSIGKLRSKQAEHETKIAVFDAHLEEQKKDMEEVKKEIGWVKKGMWAAAGTFLVFTMMMATFILTVLTHA